jgi:hypothetical protein
MSRYSDYDYLVFDMLVKSDLARERSECFPRLETACSDIIDPRCRALIFAVVWGVKLFGHL